MEIIYLPRIGDFISNCPQGQVIVEECFISIAVGGGITS